ncbi:MAG: tetratricopeptide repeat protein [Chitinophagaceae bacterium]|nr:tetratricopeptide repeat protein [Chitinophagaceae bacterium]
MKKHIGIILIFSLLLSGVYAQKAPLIDDFINQGIKLYDKGDYADAIFRYKKALLMDSRSSRANYEIASTYLAAKDYENAVKHSDLVIEVNQEYTDQAYIVKGSAQDLMGKPLDAVKTYKKGIEKIKTNNLLFYNLALTHFKLKDYKETEEALQQALTIDPYHASSHFLLALNMLFANQRVKGILALYNYLLLEPKQARTASALQTLEEEMQKGVTKAEDKTTNITIPEKREKDEFSSAELLLDLLASSNSNETNKGKSAQELFIENSNSLFNMLGELKKDKKGFWWDFYVDYFYTLASNKHTEAFCYYITQSKGDAYDIWLKDNMPKIEAFSTWYTGYLHKL